jgi:hypothetical protein
LTNLTSSLDKIWYKKKAPKQVRGLF